MDEQNPVEPSTAVEAAPEQTTPVPTLADQYDLASPAPEAIESSATEAPAAESSTAPAPSQPRNPDGTFAQAEPQHPASLVRMASDFGVSPATIKKLSTGALDDLVSDLYQRVATQQQAQPQQAPAAPEPEPDFDLGLNETDYDPGLVAAMKKIGKGSAAEIKALKAELAGYKQQAVKTQQEAFYDDLDRGFAKHADVFGAMSRRELVPGSPELLRRKAAMALIQDMPAGTLGERIAKAAAIFGITPKPPASAAAAPAAAAADGLTEEQRRWLTASTARPTHRKGMIEPRGVAAAKQAVAEQLKQYEGAGSNGSLADEFPE